MSLQVWLPLCGNIQNYGLADITFVNNGATVVTGGKIGQCLRFSANAYLTESTYNWTNFSTSHFSLCCWYKEPSPVASGNQQIVCIGTSSGWNNIRIGLLRRFTTGEIMFSVSDGSTAIQYGFASSGFTLDVWHHIAVTYNSGNLCMYLDGVLHKTMTTTIIPVLNSSQHLGVGAASGGAEKLTGFLNDVRIYDHCLSQAEIHEIAKGKMIHLKLANNGFGNPNLITRSTFTSAPWATAITGTETYKGKNAITVRNSTLYTQTSNGTTSIFPAITFAANTQYTLSLDWCDHLRSDGLNCSLYIRFKYSDNTSTQIISPASNPDANWTHAKLTSTTGKTVTMMTTTYGNSGVVSIANLKLEVGAQETAYSPPTNELDNVEYDCSGYRHDATKNAITPVFDSARYGAAAVFNGSSSYIKINDNTWMADRMPAMTINVWAKVASAWPTAARIFSCTESGGFNCEAGNSGYWRFPVHVYTSATEASVAYKFDSQEIRLSDLPVGEWVMLTWIYDLTGTKTYINGNLHHTYTNTSYGIHFYTGARLFLGCEANAASPASPWFGGQLSDFRMYATALSEEDIKILYHTSGFVDNQGNVFAGELREV